MRFPLAAENVRRREFPVFGERRGGDARFPLLSREGRHVLSEAPRKYERRKTKGNKCVSCEVSGYFGIMDRVKFNRRRRGQMRETYQVESFLLPAIDAFETGCGCLRSLLVSWGWDSCLAGCFKTGRDGERHVSLQGRTITPS